MLKAPFKTAILNPSNTLKTELKISYYGHQILNVHLIFDP